VRIETRDIIAVFTNRGARLKSWRLKHYFDQKHQPQELLETDELPTQPLPFTRANLLRQAFRFLGERYGWGHDYQGRDCSGFVSEVYRSMGVQLPRNTSDAELRAMADRGGVAGIIFWPYLRTDTQPMAIDLVRHIEHAIDVCGEDHVGLGSDTAVTPVVRDAAFEKDNREAVADMVAQGVFEKGRPADLYMFIPDLNRVDRYAVLAGMLSARGHSDARIAKILGGNFARVMTEVWG